MIQVSDSISYNAASTDAAEVVDDTEETAAAVGLGCKVLFLNRCHGVTLLPGMFFFFFFAVCGCIFGQQVSVCDQLQPLGSVF